MKIPFGKKAKETKETWAIVVPLEKWTKAATLLRDDFDKDHIVIDNIEDEDEEKLVCQITFFSDMREYVRILVALDKAGINPVTKEEEPAEEPVEEPKKEVKKKK